MHSLITSPMQLELHLAGYFFSTHASHHRQQAQARKCFQFAFHMIRVENLLAHHLIASTNTHHRSSPTMRTDNGLCHSVATQFIQVVNRALASWQQNDVGLVQLVHIIRIEQVYTRVSLQDIEIRKITDMAKQYYRYIYLALFCLDGFGSQHHRVFFFNVNVLVIRNYTQYRNTTKLFQHLDTRLKQTDIASELVDDNPLYSLAFLGSEQHQRTIDAGKNTSTINITDQNNIRFGMHRHGHIHQIRIPQIDFGQATCPFKYDGIIAF